MTSAKSVKTAQPIVIDPNFFLPPNVVDMRYANLEDAADSPTARSQATGAIVSVTYDETDFSDSGDTGADDTNASVSSVISPPDSLTVISQQMRVTTDGRFVVDVILEVGDIPGAVNYEVRNAK